MPLWLPHPSTRKGRKLEVWGAVRPAYYATLDTGKAQSVLVQFQAGAEGAWTEGVTGAIYNARGSPVRRVRPAWVGGRVTAVPKKPRPVMRRLRPARGPALDRLGFLPAWV